MMALWIFSKPNKTVRASQPHLLQTFKIINETDIQVQGKENVHSCNGEQTNHATLLVNFKHGIIDSPHGSLQRHNNYIIKTSSKAAIDLY